MSRIKPNFLVVGAGKAGTTALYNYVKHMDGVYLSDVKEPHYFSAPELGDSVRAVVADAEDYYALFEQGADALWRGEMSVTYLYYHEQTIPRILQELGPDTHIGIMLRDPIKRAYSSYLDCSRHNPNEELSFSDALSAEEQRMKDPSLSPMMHYKNMSLYAKRVAAFKQHFKHVKVVLAEDLAGNTEQVVADFSQFLQGSTAPNNLDTGRHNTGGVTWSNPTLGKFVKGFATRGLRSAANKYFPKPYLWVKRQLFGKLMQKAETIPPRIHDELAEYFRADVAELSELIGRDLSHWLQRDV